MIMLSMEEKCGPTNGEQADWMCLLANTSEGPSPHLNKKLNMCTNGHKGNFEITQIKQVGYA